MWTFYKHYFFHFSENTACRPLRVFDSKWLNSCLLTHSHHVPRLVSASSYLTWTHTLLLTHWTSPVFTSEAHIYIPVINGRGCCCQIINPAYLCVWELIFVHLYWWIMLGWQLKMRARRGIYTSRRRTADHTGVPVTFSTNEKNTNKAQ